MKKIFLFLFLALCAVSVFAQAPLIPSVRCSLTTVTIFSDPYTVSGRTIDMSSNWDATSIAAGDSLYLMDGNQLRVYRVLSITPSGTNFAASIDDINNSGQIPVTGIPGAFYRGTTNYEYPNWTSGLSEQLNMAIQNRFVQRLDASLYQRGTDYVTTDSFTTFIGYNNTSFTFNQIPVGANVWRTTTGSTYQKTSSTSMTRRGTDDGEAARLGFTQAGNTLLFNANLYNKVRVNTGNISAVTINNPQNEIFQEVGEIFMIGVTSGTSSVTVTWGNTYGTYDGTSFANLPNSTIPASATIYFKFRVISPSNETVKFQYVDGGTGNGGTFAYNVTDGGVIGDGITDNTAALTAIMATQKFIYFPAGTYVASNLTPPAGTRIVGAGKFSSKLKMLSGATGFLLSIGDGVEIEDIALDGGLTTSQSAAVSEGNRGGIYLNIPYPATTGRISIRNVLVKGFSGSGIACNGNGSGRSGYASFQDVWFLFCYKGLNTNFGNGNGGEYMKTEGCSASGCRFGFYVNSGNNDVVNCTASDCGVGIWQGGGGTGGNGGHNAIAGCTFNHCDTSLVFRAMPLGANVSACNFWYNGISVLSCSMVSFKNNTFGLTTGGKIEITGGGSNSFIGNTIFNSSITYTFDAGVANYDNILNGSAVRLGNRQALITDNQASYSSGLLTLPNITLTGRYLINRSFSNVSDFSRFTAGASQTLFNGGQSFYDDGSGGSANYETFAFLNGRYCILTGIPSTSDIVMGVNNVPVPTGPANVTPHFTFRGSSGFLGLGIQIPTERLDVVGNIKASQNVFIGTAVPYNSVTWDGLLSSPSRDEVRDAIVAIPSATTKVTKGGDTDGTPLRIGTNDAQSLELETNGVMRMRINASGTVDFQQSQIDNIDALTADSTATLAFRMEYAPNIKSRTLTTSGVLFRDGITYINSASAVTMTTNTALPDLSMFKVRNINTGTVTIAPASGLTLNGSNIILPGETGEFHRNGTVIYRLDNGGKEYEEIITATTGTDGVFVLNHPLGSSAIKFAAATPQSETEFLHVQIKTLSSGVVSFQIRDAAGAEKQVTNVPMRCIVKI